MSRPRAEVHPTSALTPASKFSEASGSLVSCRGKVRGAVAIARSAGRKSAIDGGNPLFTDQVASRRHRSLALIGKDAINGERPLFRGTPSSRCHRRSSPWPEKRHQRQEVFFSRPRKTN